MSSASAEGHFVHAGVDEAWRGDLEQQLGEQWLARQSASQRLASADADLFMIYVNPAPRVLVCGAAPDVEPLCALLLDLGWHVHVYDHRPAYIERLTDTLSHPRLTQSCDRPQALAREVPLRLYGAAIVMSHHLDSDEAYLSALATSSHWQYVGLLGPTQRRERLLEALGERADGLRGVLDGPAGIPIGGREPASIALSIAAGVHARLAACAAL